MTLTALYSSAQIDVHSHAVTEPYLEFVKANGAEMDEGFPIPAWDVEQHLAFMDKAGIQTSVLTMPAPQPYFGDSEASAAVCRRFNEECATLKARYPGRFMFCAALPLPDVEAALEEARYALETMGADGVKLATNSYGQYLGDPVLDTLMAYLDAQNAVIILHPHKPSAVNEQLMDDVPLASYEYLAETTRTVLNMVAHNVLVRYPNLKVVVPHCGSFLPNALPRFRSLLPVMVKQGYMQPVDVDANLSRLYYDLAGAPTDAAIDVLLTITTPDHLLYGSDYPYVAEPVLVEGKKALEQRLASHGLNPQDVFSDNAKRLFGEEIPFKKNGERIVRLAEIEVEPSMLEEYLVFAKEVGETSTKIEPGVLTLFSMQDKADPCKIYILEVYADQAAYQSHIQTPHFKKYKEGTAKMVKSLKLNDVSPLVGLKNFNAKFSAFQSAPHEVAIRTAIERQLATYPESTLQDIYKSFYQDRFGPGHMISDMASAWQYLLKEIAENDCFSKVYFEPTGSDGRFVRVYLAAVTDSLVTAEQLLDAFVASANQVEETSSDWASEWEEIVEVIRKNDIQVHDFEACLPVLSEAAKECQAVHHSDAYNEAYHPHYRIVERSIFEKELRSLMVE